MSEPGLTRAILETIGNAGFVVDLTGGSMTATDEKTGKRFIVRHPPDEIDSAVMELAKQVGIELEDG